MSRAYLTMETCLMMICFLSLTILHDTTELEYTTHKSLDDLGPIGNGHRRGYITHNSLAVEPKTREVIGLCNHGKRTLSRCYSEDLRQVGGVPTGHASPHGDTFFVGGLFE